MCNRLRRPRWLGLLFATHFKVGRASRLFSGILHAGLLFSAHFLIADVPVFIAIPLIFCFLSAVVIVCTFLRFTAAFPAYPPQQTKKMLGCYPQHNSMYSVFHSVSKLRIRQQPRQIQLGQQNPLRAPSKKFSSSPLLSSAHFRLCGCYRAHSFQTVEFWRLLLSTAHFRKNPPYSAQPVLLFTAQFVFSGAERLLSGAQFAKIRFFAARPAVGC
mgnify:CR=1 FL=1